MHVVPLRILCQSSDLVHLYSPATAALPSEQQLSARRATGLGMLGMGSTDSPKHNLMGWVGCLQLALDCLGLPYRPQKSSSKQHCRLRLGPPGTGQSHRDPSWCCEAAKRKRSKDLILPCNRQLAAPSQGCAMMYFTLKINHIKTRLQSTAEKIIQVETAFLGSNPCHLACFSCFCYFTLWEAMLGCAGQQDRACPVPWWLHEPRVSGCHTEPCVCIP